MDSVADGLEGSGFVPEFRELLIYGQCDACHGN
jgi:hypothetical protein